MSFSKKGGEYADAEMAVFVKKAKSIEDGEKAAKEAEKAKGTPVLSESAEKPKKKTTKKAAKEE